MAEVALQRVRNPVDSALSNKLPVELLVPVGLPRVRTAPTQYVKIDRPKSNSSAFNDGVGCNDGKRAEDSEVPRVNSP